MNDLALIPAASCLPPVSVIPRRGEQGVTIARAVEALIDAKTRANLRANSIASLKAYCRQFMKGREDVPLIAFAVDVVEEWFLRRRETPATQQSNLGRLSSLFSFAFRRKWVPENPCRFLEKVRVDRKPPVILTPLQVALILDYARRRKPGQLAYWTLSTLAGIRPDELAGVTWDMCRTDEGIVILDADVTKIRRRRIVELEPSALAWLKLAKEKNAQLPVKRMTRRRYQRQAARLLGLSEWPQDTSRHTAASFLLAKHRDANKVAFNLGNSAGILERHYKALVFQRDWDLFWSFMPDSPRPEKPKPVAQPKPEPPLVELPEGFGMCIDATPPRFCRVEQAIGSRSDGPSAGKAASARWRLLGRTSSPANARGTIRHDPGIGEAGGCVSRQTFQFTKAILRKADPDILDQLRRGKRSIAGVYRQLVA